jgi:hypothetical protein
MKPDHAARAIPYIEENEMKKSPFQGRSVLAAITAGVLLCGATAQASNVELALGDRGSLTEHATLAVQAADPDDPPEGDAFPVLLAIAVALVTMACDYAPDTAGTQYGDAAFD